MTGRTTRLLSFYIALRCCLVVLLIVTCILPSTSYAQDAADINGDEVTISLEVKGIGTADITAVIRDKDVLLPVSVLFDFLKIKNIVSASGDTVSGFYINEHDLYIVDKVHNTIKFKDTTTNIKPADLLKEENNLYLNLTYFSSIFKLKGDFNFRRLTVTLSSDLELPAIREARQEQMRKNVNRLRGDIPVDTTIKRTYPAFHFGTADWSFTSTQQSIGGQDTKVSLGLGAVVAGGEANVALNYYPGYALDETQQYYQWRYVNNDNSAVRQVMAGNIFAASIASLYAPVVGIQFTNAPTTYRKAYGTYTLSNTTDPGWIVELYVNNVLIDYKKADAAGFYTFEVPLIYGYSIIKLRFFGPYGEERTTQTYINIPFNFLPIHEFEYTASAGIVEDGRNSIFSRVGLNYGLSSHITVGGGVEYLSSITSGTTIPFINTSIKLSQNLLVSGEYDYGVKTRGTLTYRLPSNIQLDLDYTDYDKGQTAIFYNYLAERKAVLSMPIHFGSISIFSRLTVDNIIVPNANYTDAEWTFTGTIKNVGLNYSNYASFVQQTTPYMYGLFSISFKLPAKIMFTGQLQYDYEAGKPVFTKYTFEKHMLGKGFFNIAYQEFFNNSSIVEQSSGNYQNILIGMRYDFSFSRVAVSALFDNAKGYSFVESASGSLIYDKKTDYFNANNRANVGKAEIAIAPFLDINCNGKRDPGEPRVLGVKIQLNGGRITYGTDSIIRVTDLESYVNYYVTLNTNELDNIAWQIKNKVLKIAVSPNDFNLVEVPVEVYGEASGTVSLFGKGNSSLKGERQILVNIIDSAADIVAHTITESDGYFNIIGLAPGNYRVEVDSIQLKNLHLKSNHQFLPLHISANKDGDIIDGLEFTLLPEDEDITDLHKPKTDQSTKTLEPTTDHKTSADTANDLASGRRTIYPENGFDSSAKNVSPQPDNHAKANESVLVNGKRSPTLEGYPSDQSLYDMAVDISKLYRGTIICVLNDHSDIIDLQIANANGEFSMFGYKPCRVTLPPPGSGIVSQTIFLNDYLELLTTVNMRVVNGRLVYSLNNREPLQNRVRTKIFTVNQQR